ASDVGVIDLRERAEALLVPSTAVALPVADAGRRVRLAHGRAADRCCLAVLRPCAGNTQRKQCRHECRPPNAPARPFIHSSTPSVSCVHVKVRTVKGKPGCGPGFPASRQKLRRTVSATSRGRPGCPLT